MKFRRPVFRDLGFGSVVADQSRSRLLNRDGSFNVIRRGLDWRSAMSLFYSLIAMSWPRFLALGLGLYLATNAAFALGYFALGPAALAGPAGPEPGSRLWQAFFFSVQTLSTVGYGHVVPATLAANLVMTAETVVGLFGVALATGLLFARFSRPVADIVFSRNALIAPYRGIRAFEFRIANRRRNQIIDLSAKVIYSRLEERGSERHRRFYDLSLERREVSFFPLSWTIVHPIDEDSPLFGIDEHACEAGGSEFLVLLTGIDETFSQTVHARTSYRAHEVVWNARFAPIFNRSADGEPLTIDIGRLSELEPATAEAARAAPAAER